MPSNWNRFTLMDSVVLVAAFAIGMGFSSGFSKTNTPFSRAHPEAAWAATSTVWSGMVSGPLILLGQRFRGRRSPLSLGERLWLTPLSLYLLLPTFSVLCGPVPVAVIRLWVAGQCGFSLAAACCLIASVLGKRSAPACRWTDLVGCLACTAIGLALALAVYDAFGWL